MTEKKILDVVLYGRRKCHLCDDVEIAIRALAEEFPLRLQLVDIESDEALHEELMLVIPAVRIDGEMALQSVTHVPTFHELREAFLSRIGE